MPAREGEQPRRGHRLDIEGMRAVAVGLVVAYHAGIGVISGGFVGVDVFFVLSGFLITGLLADELQRSGHISFATFYGRRARRLLPMSTVVLVATAVAFAGVLSPLDRGSLVADIRAAALYIANWHFAAGSLNYLSDPARSPVLHFWSLSVEEQFYVVWPVLLVLATRGRRGGAHARPDRHRRMVIALAVLLACSLALSAVLTSRSAPYSYYGLHTRAWELAAGGLLALGADPVARLPRPARALGGWAGLAMVVASALAFGSGTVFPGLAATLPVVGTVLMVAAGGPGVRYGLPRLLSAAPLTYVGRLSYAWYLWHWPCLLYAGALTGSVVAADNGAEVPTVARGWAAVAAVVVSLALSALSHAVLEDPVRRSRWLAAVRARSLALGAGLTATSVGLAGLLLPAATAVGATTVLADVAAQVGSHAGGSGTLARPVRLRLSPVQARRDTPRGTRDCYVGYASSLAADDCRFGDPTGTKVLALVGDSHAEQWFPAYDALARRKHWQLWLWTKPNCPMVDLTVRLSGYGGAYPSCAPWRTAVLHRLAALSRLDAVVVAHYGTYLNRLGTAADVPLTAAQAGPAWQQAWVAMQQRLGRLARAVIVMRDVPKPVGDVPACLASHGRDIRRCEFPRARAFTQADVLYAAERAGAGPRTHFVDLDRLLCPGTICPVVWPDGTVMFRDAHHLSASMSLLLAGPLGRLVAPLL